MTPDDAAVLRIFAGRPRRPGAHMILPSGVILSADEANVYTDAYLPADGSLPDRSVPPHMRANTVTVSLADLADDFAEGDRLRAALADAQKHAWRMWMLACLYAGTTTVVLTLLIWHLTTT